jgi:hypothetical protein
MVKPVFAPSADFWVSKAPMQEARSDVGVAVVNGKIYAIGGRNSTYSLVSNNEMYDPSSDTWTTLASMPTARARFGIAACQNKIYVIGGTTGSVPIVGGLALAVSVVTGVNEVYDPATDTWETKAQMPTARDVLKANVVDGKIYLIGGSSGLNQIYNPNSDSWTTGVSIPTPRNNLAVAVVNDMLYAIGGRNTADPSALNILADNDQYTPIGYSTVSPNISVASPENNGTYASSNVSLTFTVNKPVLWLGYSLDGQETVTITGNITLSGLASGLHNITVYAKDEFENTGTSETITFTIAKEPEPFPIRLAVAVAIVVAAVVLVAAVGVGLSAYLKKRK